MTKKPKWEDLPNEVKEKHLTEDCGLTILEEVDFLPESENWILEQLPLDYPTWNAGTAELWEPENQHYEANFDRVLSVSSESKDVATIQLMRMCMKQNCRKVGEMYFSTGRWCVRARDVE